MADELRLQEVGGGDPEMAQVLAMADTMRDALVAGGYDWSDDNALGVAVTAATMLAGILFGQSIAIGLAKDGDRRRAGEAALRNFRTGTDAGKRGAIRMIIEQGGSIAS